MGYPSNHYMAHNSTYYSESTPVGGSGGGGTSGTGNGGYRDRNEWSRDRDYVDYRREYDRRPPPPPSSGTS